VKTASITVIGVALLAGAVATGFVLGRKSPERSSSVGGSNVSAPDPATAPQIPLAAKAVVPSPLSLEGIPSASSARTDVINSPPQSAPSVEFDQLYAQGRLGAIHSKFLKDSRDEVAATALEESWRRYYAAKPEVAQYGVPEVQCRRELCEVRLLAAAPIRAEDSMALMTGSSAAASQKAPNGYYAGDVRQEEGVTAIIFYFNNKFILKQ
jgi:hypothetical protein